MFLFFFFSFFCAILFINFTPNKYILKFMQMLCKICTSYVLRFFRSEYLILVLDSTCTHTLPALVHIGQTHNHNWPWAYVAVVIITHQHYHFWSFVPTMLGWPCSHIHIIHCQVMGFFDMCFCEYHYGGQHPELYQSYQAINIVWTVNVVISFLV